MNADAAVIMRSLPRKSSCRSAQSSRTSTARSRARRHRKGGKRWIDNPDRGYQVRDAERDTLITHSRVDQKRQASDFDHVDGRPPPCPVGPIRAQKPDYHVLFWRGHPGRADNLLYGKSAAQGGAVMPALNSFRHRSLALSRCSSCRSVSAAERVQFAVFHFVCRARQSSSFPCRWRMHSTSQLLLNSSQRWLCPCKAGSDLATSRHRAAAGQVLTPCWQIG